MEVKPTMSANSTVIWRISSEGATGAVGRHTVLRYSPSVKTENAGKEMGWGLPQEALIPSLTTRSADIALGNSASKS